MLAVQLHTLFNINTRLATDYASMQLKHLWIIRVLILEFILPCLGCQTCLHAQSFSVPYVSVQPPVLQVLFELDLTFSVSLLERKS